MTKEESFILILILAIYSLPFDVLARLPICRLYQILCRIHSEIDSDVM